MRTKSILYMLAALLLFGLGTPAYAQTAAQPAEPLAFEEGRNIYVGDIITLEISASRLSAEELQERFGDFEIVELKEMAGRYALSLRTFEPGEYTVPLGDKEIVITVGSTLLDIGRDDVFEGATRVMAAGFPFHWRVLFYIAAGFFVLCGGYALAKAVLKKRKKPLSPYQMFLQRCSALMVADDNYFVYLTLYFKEYLEALYQCRIIGKTSAEILHELQEIQPLETMLHLIGVWLRECDRLKFTGISVSDEQKQRHYEKLLELVGSIDSHHELNQESPGISGTTVGVASKARLTGTNAEEEGVHDAIR
jgi:hypothetical protein